jgi:hypothetical protein
MSRFFDAKTDESSLYDELEEIFLQQGFGDRASKLSAFAAVAAANLEGPEERWIDVLEDAAEKLKKHAGEPIDVLLLLLLQELAGNFVGRRADASALASWLANNEPRLELSSSLRRAFELVPYGPVMFERSGATKALLATGLIEPGRFLDAVAIRQTERRLPGRSYNPDAIDNNPALPRYWLALDRDRVLIACVELLRREPIDTLGELAWALERLLDPRYSEEAARLEPHFTEMAEVICERWKAEDRASDILLTECCWQFAMVAIQQSPSGLASYRDDLTKLAWQELGRMRSGLRADEDQATRFLGERNAYLNAAMFFLLRSDPSSTAGVLRRLLLAFRELRWRSVPSDLRTWHEPSLEPLPQPWVWIPERINLVLEIFLRRETEKNAELEHLRVDLAQFCLDRLKSREKKTHGTKLVDGDMVEPDPSWREGYVRAALELHVNPGGRGHRTLDWSAENDPDSHVREAASSGSELMRREKGRIDGSPRSRIYAALRWLRQAHVLALGGTPDENGIKRTIRKEVRRTRELEDEGF